MKDISIYIHIPFCESKCYYCDFISFVDKEDRISSYIAGLILEIESYREVLKDYEIKTIFIGGGTPSLIEGRYIEEIMENLYKNFNISVGVEISMESNPGTITRDKVRTYHEVGINRISMGAQSFNDELLNNIGRIHDVKDIYDSLEILRNGGMENINIDLMSGLPNQKLSDVLYSLEEVIRLKIPHVSCYSLILEEATELYELFLDGEIDLVDEELDREMYHRTREILIGEGYNHYEISNYALEGYECKHNLVYWDIEPYLGLGLGSHSNMNNERFYNVSNLEEYMSRTRDNKSLVEQREYIDQREEIVEYCIMGIRKIKGINRLDFKERFNEGLDYYYKEMIDKHVSNGLLIDDGESIYLSEKGLDLANLVEIDFLE